MNNIQKLTHKIINRMNSFALSGNVRRFNLLIAASKDLGYKPKSAWGYWFNPLVTDSKDSG
jgi:hypothetical protein